jgi:hypothetical protein
LHDSNLAEAVAENSGFAGGNLISIAARAFDKLKPAFARHLAACTSRSNNK